MEVSDNLFFFKPCRHKFCHLFFGTLNEASDQGRHCLKKKKNDLTSMLQYDKLIGYLIISPLQIYIHQMKPFYLSYDVALIQWITSCHKNCMTTHAITLWRVDIT